MVRQMMFERVISVESFSTPCTLKLVLAVYFLMFHKLVLPVETLATRATIKYLAVFMPEIMSNLVTNNGIKFEQIFV